MVSNLTAAFPANNIKVNAKDVFRFVKTYARDLKTTTPIPVVNSYTSGGTFGFRFSPTFQAQANPASQKARAANVLLPTTFPALVTVVVNEVDLMAASQAFAKERHERAPVAPKIAHDMAIMAHMNSRWYVKDAGGLLQRIFWPMKRDSGSPASWGFRFTFTSTLHYDRIGRNWKMCAGVDLKNCARSLDRIPSARLTWELCEFTRPQARLPLARDHS